jgi:hypothetical protein
MNSTRGYYQRLVEEAGFPGDTRSVRDVFESAVDAPTQAKLRAAGAICAMLLESATNDEVYLALLDISAILAVERRWLYLQESKP